MIEFRVLGTLDLRTPEGVEIRSVLAQPKRVALLAYLAVQGGGGFHRRDTLLPLFWPEADTERARRALRQSLHFLRQSLGEGVIVSRGDEEVGIDPARLCCDATELARALESGSYAQAVELYRGDLLQGFFISGAPDFEQWVEHERTRLRERATGAAWALALEAEGAGEAEHAAQLARRAVALSRDDEPALRKLIALLGRIGNPAGALRAYEDFAQRLAREYEIEPSAETRKLVDALRSPVPSAPVVLPPVPVMEAGTRKTAVTPAAIPVPGLQQQAPARVAWGGPQRVSLLLLLLLAVVVGGGVALARLHPRAATPASANVVAVLPFSYHGSGESAYLADGIVRLLSTNLNGAGELRSVDPRALLNAVDQTSEDALDLTRGRALAERFGAGTFVLGHIIEAGGRLRITAVVYDRNRPAGTPVEEVTVEGDASQLLILVDQLTAKLLAGRGAEPQGRLNRLAALTTHSLPALKAYLEGEREYRVGRYAEARDAFGRAVDLDSSFALAYYRLSGAANWTSNDVLADTAQSRALQHSQRLAERERRLVQAWRLYRSGGPVEAERLYRAVLQDHPDDVEAWFQLGEVQFHWGPTLGRPATESRAAFERVLAYEPANVGALVHLARVAADEGKLGEMDFLVSRTLALQPETGVALQMRALRAFAMGDRSAQEQVLTALNSASEGLLNSVVIIVPTHSGNLPGAVGLARRLTAPEWTPLFRARGHMRLAQLELARGRWSAAKAALLSAESFKQNLASELRGAFAAFPLLHPPRPELEAIRRQLAGVPAVESFAGIENSDSLSVIYAPHQHYLLGLLSTRLGDPATALGYAMRLDRHGGAAVDSALARDLAGALRAQVAWSQDPTREALQHLGEARLLQTRTLPVLLNYAKADERWLRAELLRSLGRDEEALRWYSSFPDPSGYDVIYLAPSHLRRAEILEKMGQRQEAARHYARFLVLWKDADPELQSLLREARQGLARVQAVGRR